MFKIEIELPETTQVKLGDTGLLTIVDLKAIALAHPQVIRFMVIGGAHGALNNISRGTDESGKPNTDAVWASAREKRMLPWHQGTWTATEREESLIGQMRDQYIAERVIAGKTPAQVEKDIRAAVTRHYGKDEKATFARFLDAAARDKTGASSDAACADERKAIYDNLLARTQAAIAERAKASAKIDTSSIDLGL